MIALNTIHRSGRSTSDSGCARALGMAMVHIYVLERRVWSC